MLKKKFMIDQLIVLKFNKMYVEKKIYDRSIDRAINAYKKDEILITSEMLDGKAKRFSLSIMKAVDNELF